MGTRYSAVRHEHSMSLAPVEIVIVISLQACPEIKLRETKGASIDLHVRLFPPASPNVRTGQRIAHVQVCSSRIKRQAFQLELDCSTKS